MPEKMRSLVLSFLMPGSWKTGKVTGVNSDLSDTGMHGGAPLIALRESIFLHLCTSGGPVSAEVSVTALIQPDYQQQQLPFGAQMQDG